MIETDDIYRAINSRLELAFPDIPVMAKDMKTPEPPCFYIKFVTGSTSQSAIEYENENLAFNVLYFSQSNTLSDLVVVSKQLKQIFKKPLKIEMADTGITQWQEINGINESFNEEDYVLSCTLDINLIQCQQYYDKTSNFRDTNFIDRYDEYDNDELIEEIEI